MNNTDPFIRLPLPPKSLAAPVITNRLPIVTFEYPASDTGKMKLRYVRVTEANGDHIKGYEIDDPLSKKDGVPKTFSRTRIVKNGVALLLF